MGYAPAIAKARRREEKRREDADDPLLAPHYIISPFATGTGLILIIIPLLNGKDLLHFKQRRT